MSENGSMIHARGLVKRFGDLVAVDGIDLDVRPGEAFGFLGPNGAGKSSTMRMSHRRTWPIIVSGFFEPLFYLLALGYGLGGYVGEVAIDGRPIEYAAFVAPALLAASAFNGAFYDATNIFWKLRYQKVYDAVLDTTGTVGAGLLVNVAYLTVLGLAGAWIASRRISKLLLT